MSYVLNYAMPAFPFVPAVIVVVPPGALRYQLGWLRPATTYIVTATGTCVDGSNTPESQAVTFATSKLATVSPTPVSTPLAGSWSPVGAAGFSAGMADYTSLALGATGTPYVAYSDGGNSCKVTVQKFDGTSWGPVGTAGFSAGTANYVSLALGATDTPYVAYKDGGNSNKATVQKFA